MHGPRVARCPHKCRLSGGAINGDSANQLEHTKKIIQLPAQFPAREDDGRTELRGLDVGLPSLVCLVKFICMQGVRTRSLGECTYAPTDVTCRASRARFHRIVFAALHDGGIHSTRQTAAHDVFVHQSDGEIRLRQRASEI